MKLSIIHVLLATAFIMFDQGAGKDTLALRRRRRKLRTIGKIENIEKEKESKSSGTSKIELLLGEDHQHWGRLLQDDQDKSMINGEEGRMLGGNREERLSLKKEIDHWGRLLVDTSEQSMMISSSEPQG
mmetsp:Transcript_13789/g.15309  ORF Transcript_13789/g.15309 Transcript_13789/m.15309 type:complete len:129 (+) Transcript_13789:106-492(+)|eukprot:CAMPEP_0194146760 /NCGR_PEP_ID=MMETSP0152-20130528/21591_1 /TAXON_ID=1049557 /ORGANISM="Thalassiothrix antarctica, Strain L6-D1" /LENGTH=128 /DNA_ID=CAMNT_0038847351 /DNA_START=88 /DNA_END=474 /DNA_ORIENTATION=-